MDPVTSALVAVLAASGKDVLGKAVRDGYEGLKALLKRKFGEKKDLAEAVEALEKKPESVGRRETLREEIVEAGAAEDADAVELAKELLAKLQALPGGKTHIQEATGHHIAQADRGGVAIVSTRDSDDRDD